MFEAYNEIGVSNIVISDYFSGLASFLVVAGGGTIIGKFALFFLMCMWWIVPNLVYSILKVMLGDPKVDLKWSEVIWNRHE